MTFKDMFYTLFKTFNPDSYKELTEYPFSKAMKYFGFILFWSLIIMSLLFIPSLLAFPKFWQSTTTHFDNLALNYDVSVKNSFNILNDPLIKISKDKVNMTDERLLVTEEALYYKQFFFFGKTQTIPIDKQTNLLESNLQVSVGLFILFIIPALLFWSFVFFALYFWIIIFITFLIGLIMNKIFKLNHPASNIIRITVYSSTILVLLQLILMPFFRLVFIPIIAYWILFLIVLLITKQEEKKKNKREDKIYSKREREDIFASHHSKSKDIFANHSSGSSKSSPSQDSYDVDEHGNLKSSKKKNSSADSYDDYVMLK